VWDGVILDGHNRHRICRELDVPYDVRERPTESREEAIEWICSTSLARRSLTPEAAADLRGRMYAAEKNGDHDGGKGKERSADHNDPHLETSDLIAARTGVSRMTVKRDHKFHQALNILEDAGIPRAEFTSGTRKTKRKEVVKLGEIAKEDPKKALSAWKRVEEQGATSGAIKAAIRDDENEALAAEIEKTSDSLIEIKKGDFMQALDDVKPGSIDVIITDPPYPAEFLHTWSGLSQVAMHVLPPGGFCIAYSGKQHLDEVIERMKSAGLNYFWQIIFKQTVQATIHPRKVNTGYKPILIFQKPPITPPDQYFQDFLTGEKVEKDQHEWQQSENGFAWLIERFSRPGQRILEPFSGGGTCPVVAKQMQRKCLAYEIDEKAHAASCARVFTD
tara:strand:- start:362 stop:1534 length:1173 start_codon:yes stop_codon:yes gene_type:complete